MGILYLKFILIISIFYYIRANGMVVYDYWKCLENFRGFFSYKAICKNQKLACFSSFKWRCRVQGAGEHKVEWDASNYSSGVYFYRIQMGKFTDVKKAVVVK